ncbi:DUF1800 domain-containing protein [Duganella sp. BJB1802]|uniref:DUF1800 domain-containing protein n=1 Tax=Duganella sp. BJB1802 TaxID=2744575 RepID=UPI00159448D8|nr:DUF1800 domain-containing protein [Duganella sp. BJB1802]NVD73465.1 DUF1800 domain-containing protein [Duganella sp. BJB1802]
MKLTSLKLTFGLVLALGTAACGGGGGGGSIDAGERTSSSGPISNGVKSGVGRPGNGPSAPLTPAMPDAPEPSGPAAAPLTPAAASHFLAQATFGPTAAEIASLVGSTRANWINSQLTKPQTLHRNYLQSLTSVLPAGAPLTQNHLLESFWKQAVIGDDQLRQRVTFALSQIFVISYADEILPSHPAGVASYYDMLGQHAFGNFRDLLQGVALHPMMGIYLSHLHNQKEDGARVPDENFAREIMQLMSIGLYQLNPDGSQKLQNGKPVETYTHDDVAGLAKVFTGWSWAGPDQSRNRFFGAVADPARDWTPMQNYPTYHSTSTKSFLGTQVSGGSGATDLKAALDTLFQHPNVGPFIGRQLIQRLVSSNPSPAYIGRVAAAFANNGNGVRGDMRAVVRAVLLDPEAADNGSAKKLREPVLRLANWMRAFNAKAASGRFQLPNLDDPLNGLGQTPLRSPSVFNFFRPSYSPPNTTLSARGLVAPEMQITAEPSVTGYLNYMQSIIPRGAGMARDIMGDYRTELALAAQPAQLMDRINLLLTNGAMSSTLRNQIISALNSIGLPAATAGNAATVDAARKNRVYMAIYLTMASPEYLAQH